MGRSPELTVFRTTDCEGLLQAAKISQQRPGLGCAQRIVEHVSHAAYDILQSLDTTVVEKCGPMTESSQTRGIEIASSQLIAQPDVKRSVAGQARAGMASRTSPTLEHKASAPNQFGVANMRRRWHAQRLEEGHQVG
jgi:hypothetical protein